ncbi:CD164 sialomucin-like 2 protein [Centroberyx affinis]|uniref:CD164 sialomucin-like 2 protein n=1 Tax=Centroberyx affinis TaxID=166261 RepID=UPI003A5BEC4E
MRGLVPKALCSTLLLLAMVTAAYSQSDCSQAQSCDMCVGNSILNLTGCVWRLCPNGNDTGICMIDEGDSTDNSMNCTWTRLSELCTAVETVADGGDDGSSPKSGPDFSQAKFDMSSFIGGIILVLCVQAGGFFAMRFLKSKEQSNYDPISQLSAAQCGRRACSLSLLSTPRVSLHAPHSGQLFTKLLTDGTFGRCEGDFM